MSRLESWWFNALALVVSATGIAYFWMKYLLRNDDPFSVVNHPWQPAMLHAHILAAPFLILLIGMVVRSHVLKKMQNSHGRSNRISGILSLLSFGVMTVSGYLLQVFTSSEYSRILMIAHLSSGGVFAGSYLIHLAVGIFIGKTKLGQSDKNRLAA